MPAPTSNPPVSRGDFLERVSDLCIKFDGSVVSWHRSVRHNKIVGGSPVSKHLTGWACDVVLDNMSMAVRDKLVQEARRRGLWVSDEADHIHLQGLAPAGSTP